MPLLRIMLLSPTFGPLVLVTFKMASDLAQLMVLLAALLHAFAAAFFYLAHNAEPSTCLAVDKDIRLIYWHLLLAPLGGESNIMCLENESDSGKISTALLLVYQVPAVIYRYWPLWAAVTYCWRRCLLAVTDRHGP